MNNMIICCLQWNYVYTCGIGRNCETQVKYSKIVLKKCAMYIDLFHWWSEFSVLFLLFAL